MVWLPFVFLFYFLCLLAERALVGLSAHDLEALKGESSQSTRHALLITSDIRNTLAALLMARIVLIIVASVGATSFVFHLEPSSYWISQNLLGENWTLFIVGVALAIGITLVFAGLQRINAPSKKPGKGVLVLERLWWFVFFWKAIFKLFAPKEKKVENGKLNDDRRNMPVESAASEKRELELLKSIVQFGDVTVKQVMQPRSKVVAVEFKMTFPELLELVRQSEFSRLPVYDEDFDNVTGILYVKDLVTHLDEPDDFEWQPLIRTNVLMVPEAKRGSELLEEFKRERMHMAVVVDEYGGSAGIVTLEDILEEVTGDIRDEFDEENDIRYKKIDEYNYIFEGQTLLNDVCRITGLAGNTFDEVRSNADTLAGLALELRGDIPALGEEISWGGYVLTVSLADRRRIEQLKLTLPKT